jgi:hypothetical protein
MPFGERSHHLQHLAHAFGIERGRGFVEQDRLRPHCQRPRDADPLLLPPDNSDGSALARSSRPTRASSVIAWASAASRGSRNTCTGPRSRFPARCGAAAG